MGRIVFAGAMSHVLDPDYYQAACGEVGRQKVTAAMEAIERMGERFVAKKALLELTADELHKTGSHEFLNWMVLLGAVTPARAAVRYFGELPRINLAAVEWSL